MAIVPIDIHLVGRWLDHAGEGLICRGDTVSECLRHFEEHAGPSDCDGLVWAGIRQILPNGQRLLTQKISVNSLKRLASHGHPNN